MKLPNFDRSKMEWDSWHAFHITHEGYNKFVQFDTGEVVVCYRRWQPDNRRDYPELHVQIVATDDEKCPKLYIPGDTPIPIPKSHLNHNGQQILLVDFDHKRAVSLDRVLNRADNPPPIPERFLDNNNRDISAYYAGPNAVPIGSPITRHYPTPLTYDQRKHIKELEDACKVWLQMQPNPDELKKQHRKEIAPPVLEFVDVSFSVLTLAHRTAIAEHGFNMIAKYKHSWLTFNVEGGR